MILAAGRGERMRPLTDATPKPLLMAGSKRLIEWQIASLVHAGVQRIVINHAWLGSQFQTALGDGARYGCTLLYSAESPALETAGGIARALPLLGDTPFIVVSGDIYTDFNYACLQTHATTDSAHLVLVTNPDYNANGDMGLENGGIAPQSEQKFTYANIGVFHPEIFKKLDPQQAKKLFPWLYAQSASGALTGELFHGAWHNVGTPQQLATLNHFLSKQL